MRSLCLVTLANAVLVGLCKEIQATAELAPPSPEVQETLGSGVPGAGPPAPGAGGGVGVGAAGTQEAEDGKPTYSGSAKPVDCLSTFNKARTAAGLPSFVSAGTEFRVEKPEGQDGKFFTDVCQALMTQTPVKQNDDSFNRTIALAVQDGTEGDCAAAVTHFNGALSLFGDLPPAFSTDENSVYRKLQAVSFVALYNPKENPKLDCGYFTCTKSVTQSTTTPPKTEPGPEAAAASAGSPSPADETVTTTLHGLLCASSPPALIAGQAPFEQETYDKIKAAINSASSAMPAVLTLALSGAAFFFY